MSVQELKRENELYNMFEIDSNTKKKIKNLTNKYEQAGYRYFEKLFNILHKDILNESKNRYCNYIVKHTVLKNKLKELIKNKNNYEYKYYVMMVNDIIEQMKNNKKSHFGRSDGLFKRIGKAKFLLDEKYYDEKKIIKKLDKIKKYIREYYY